MVGTISLVKVPFFYVFWGPAIKGLYEEWYKSKDELGFPLCIFTHLLFTFCLNVIAIIGSVGAAFFHDVFVRPFKPLLYPIESVLNEAKKALVSVMGAYFYNLLLLVGVICYSAYSEGQIASQKSPWSSWVSWSGTGTATTFDEDAFRYKFPAAVWCYYYMVACTGLFKKSKTWDIQGILFALFVIEKNNGIVGGFVKTHMYS